ncbi:hypothetical protein HY643_02495 [Candidatus Woesearchaeota archaeon]|nr:hypothetical protein [Candidatus Woesearchaeota archaeon]
MKTVTRKEFFKTEEATREIYKRCNVEGKMPFEQFLQGDVREFIQTPNTEVKDQPYWLRIGSDITPVDDRFYIPIDKSATKDTLSNLLEQYVHKFDAEAFAEEMELSPKDTEEVKSKLAPLQRKMEAPNILYEVQNGLTDISLNTPVSSLISYRVGAVEDNETGEIIFTEHNLIDIVLKERNKGGKY